MGGNRLSNTGLLQMTTARSRRLSATSIMPPWLFGWQEGNPDASLGLLIKRFLFKRSSAEVILHQDGECGTWWHNGRVEAFRPEGRGFEFCNGFFSLKNGSD